MSEPEWVVPYRPRGSIFGPGEQQALHALLEGEETLSCGGQRDAFELEFACAIGASHAVALTSCTVALEFATRLIGLEPGDEVLAVSQTYHATLQPLLDYDVTVRFCEIEPDTLNIDCTALASLISPRTRAIYVVHHGGLCVDLDALSRLASDNGLRIIEDCAHALPCTHNGRHAGTLDLGCFSFQSYKNISTLGEGGMLTARRLDDAERARLARAIEPLASYTPRRSGALGAYSGGDPRIMWHHRQAFGRDCVDVHWAGTNSTLAEPACAVGRVQLRRLNEMVDCRRAIAARYDEALAGREIVSPLNPPPEGDQHAHHLYTFRLNGTKGMRDVVLAALVDAGIEVQQRYFPVHLMPEWRLRNGTTILPVTERVWFEEQVQLPIYPQMLEAHVDYVIDALVGAITPRKSTSRC
jgi:perosamine synthetase